MVSALLRFKRKAPDRALAADRRRAGGALRVVGIFSVYLILANLGWALDVSHDIYQYTCRVWSRQNGLPVSGINAIAQTPDGYLWLGTVAGLVRFDGTGFDASDVSQVGKDQIPNVRSLAVTRDGKLWVGSENGGFGFYDGEKLLFRRLAEWGGPTLNVRALWEGKDKSIWIASQFEGAQLTPEGQFKTFTLAKDHELNILAGMEDMQGREWFSTANFEIFYFRDGKITKFRDSTVGSILCMAQSADGLLWFGGNKGMLCYDANLNPVPLPPLADAVTALLVDRRGTLWLGTNSLGVGTYRNGKYQLRGKADGLSGNHISALAEDKEGSIWIGTEAGLSQLTDVKFPLVPPGEFMIGDYATSVCTSKRGGIWIGHRAGVSYYDGHYKTYSLEAGLPDASVKRVFEASNGDVYMVSGLRKLVILSGEKAVATYDTADLIVGITEDAEGVVVSSGGKLFRASPQAFVPYPFRGDSPNFKWILNLLATQDGSLWVACENGLCRIKEGTARFWGRADGIADPRVQGVAADEDGIIWISLFNGVARLKDERISPIGRGDGLFDSNIYAIVSDHLGSLWIDSGKGVFRVSRAAMNDFAEGKSRQIDCIPYDSAESISNVDKTGTQERVGCRSQDGRIWFPTAKGVVMIDPANILSNPVPPPVHVNRVLANRVLFAPTQHVVPPGDGELEFHFNALTFIAPEKVRFRYQLKGYDHDWVEAGGRRIAFYTNLKAGHYTFKVTASNADGVWNTVGDALEIELQPHFYETVWFYLVGGGSLAASLAGAYLVRMRRLNLNQRALQERRDLLEAEVRNRTAELASVNHTLQREIEDHKRTEIELVTKTRDLEKEIEERIQMQLEIDRVHQALVDSSRKAGRAEIATNVLHNVGNVLNSVNVSSSVALDAVRKSSISGLTRVVEMLRQHENDLASFLANDPRGQKIVLYLSRLSDRLLDEQAITITELDSLRKNIEHIKEIVVMQQDYATVSGVEEILNIRELIEDSIKINHSALDRHRVELIRDFHPVPQISADKHKILQILVNMVSNAEHACTESEKTDKRVIVRLVCENDRIKISVSDNGVGVKPENITRIFNHGFTTRKQGHGFGLHSGAIAAKEMGGSLTLQSDGPGRGATFTLELPCAISAENPAQSANSEGIKVASV